MTSDAAIAQVEHDAFRVLRGLIGRERDVERVGGDEAPHFVGRVAVRDEGDPRTVAPRARERVHHVEARRINPHDRHRHACLQIRAVGTARDHDIGTARAGGLDFPHRVFEAVRDDAQVRAFDVFAGDVEKQIAQAADAERPDARALGWFEQSCAQSGGSWQARKVRPLCAYPFPI